MVIRGIVAGTGSTAVTISDYALDTLITHGVGAGQLEYAASSFGSNTVAGSTSSFTASRVLTNSSGASITVNEIGIYMEFVDLTTQRYFCIARDLGGGAVAHGETITIEYKISVTV